MFYDPVSTFSYSAFKCWIKNNPIAADGDSLASYDQVEIVILSFGLAFRVIWIVQFPQQYLDVPTYIINSCYPFSEYDQLSHCIQDLLSGCAETYVHTADGYILLIQLPTQAPGNKNHLSA